MKVIVSVFNIILMLFASVIFIFFGARESVPVAEAGVQEISSG